MLMCPKADTALPNNQSWTCRRTDRRWYESALKSYTRTGYRVNVRSRPCIDRIAVAAHPWGGIFCVDPKYIGAIYGMSDQACYISEPYNEQSRHTIRWNDYEAITIQSMSNFTTQRTNCRSLMYRYTTKIYWYNQDDVLILKLLSKKYCFIGTS